MTTPTVTDEDRKCANEVFDALDTPPGCSLDHVAQLIAARVAEATAKLRADIDELTWNLAGCDTIASGWGKPFDYDKILARSAINSVSRMAEKLIAAERERDELRKELPAFIGYAKSAPMLRPDSPLAGWAEGLLAHVAKIEAALAATKGTT